MTQQPRPPHRPPHGPRAGPRAGPRSAPATLLPGYEHDLEAGAGLSPGPGHPKVVIHTTESPRGSWAGVRNLWRGSSSWGRGLPHFLADGSRYVQLLPLNVAAYTLENKAGGADTNRSGPAIQVEICGYAADGLNDAELEALGKWLADLVAAGVGIDLGQHPRFYGPSDGIVLATYDAPQRLSAAAYQAFGGFLGHQHVPENAHWDPGRLDADRVERIARAHLKGEPEDDMPRFTSIIRTKVGSKWALRNLGRNDVSAYLLVIEANRTVRNLTGASLQQELFWQSMNIGDVWEVDDAFLEGGRYALQHDDKWYG